MKTFLMALSIASSLLVTRLQAQSPDRADLLKQERAARIEEATPPQRTTIERGMNFLQKAREGFERLMGDENGWHYSSGDFPAGAGIRPGVGYSHDSKWVDGYAQPDRPNRLTFDWNAAYTTREYYQTALKTQLLNIGGSIFNVGLHGKYFEHPEDDFFGIGPDTRQRGPHQLSASFARRGRRRVALSHPRFSRWGWRLLSEPECRLRPRLAVSLS